MRMVWRKVKTWLSMLHLRLSLNATCGAGDVGKLVERTEEWLGWQVGSPSFTSTLNICGLKMLCYCDDCMQTSKSSYNLTIQYTQIVRCPLLSSVCSLVSTPVINLSLWSTPVICLSSSINSCHLSVLKCPLLSSICSHESTFVICLSASINPCHQFVLMVHSCHLPVSSINSCHQSVLMCPLMSSICPYGPLLSSVCPQV